MLSFLTPYRLEAEIIGAVLLIAMFTGLWLHHDSVEKAAGFASCEAKLTDSRQQAQARAEAAATRYEQQIQDATAANNSVPLSTVIRTPVWLHDPGQICPGATEAPTAASGVRPNTGGIQPGPGDRDIRPGIEAFKVRYENVLKKCQLTLDEWPK